MFLLPFKRTFIEVNPIAQHLGGQKYKWGPTYPISKDLDVLMELTAFPRSISLLHHVRSSHLDKHDFIHHLETTRTWCYGEPAPGLRSTPSPRPTQILMCTHRHPSLLTKPPPTHTQLLRGHSLRLEVSTAAAWQVLGKTHFGKEPLPALELA